MLTTVRGTRRRLSAGRVLASVTLLLAVLVPGSAPAAVAPDVRAADAQIDLFPEPDVRLMAAALCATQCLAVEGEDPVLTSPYALATPEGRTSVRFADVPYGRYRVAVAYQLLDPDNGTPLETGASYLRLPRDGSGRASITSRFEDGSTVRLNAPRHHLGSWNLELVERPIPDRDPRVRVRVVATSGLMSIARITYRATQLTPQAVVVHTVRGCRDRLIARKRVTGRTGAHRYVVRFPMAQARRTTRVAVVVRQPDRGAAHTTDTFVLSDYGCR